MSKEDDDRKRRHDEMVDEVYRALIASLRVMTARRKMRTTKIKTGAAVDELPPKVPDGRLPPHRRRNPSPAKAAPPPPEPRKPAPPKVVELRPGPKKTDMAEVMRHADILDRVLKEMTGGDVTGLEMIPDGDPEKVAFLKKVYEEADRRMTELS